MLRTSADKVGRQVGHRDIMENAERYEFLNFSVHSVYSLWSLWLIIKSDYSSSLILEITPKYDNFNLSYYKLIDASTL